MSATTPIPPALREWAQAIVGPVSERNVSHNRPNSRVWELTYDTGRAFAKLSPNPTSFGRETRALREVAPNLKPGTVPLGVPNGDREIVERGRATLARLEVPTA
ncbi:hypothetical protein [Streptomyces sp. NPDC001980]|uniref:hypothetical protein n=1 Tax=Streptomyces sp. NPDC001980 TaxID=3157126 RepID=UPI00332FDF2E